MRYDMRFPTMTPAGIEKWIEEEFDGFAASIAWEHGEDGARREEAAAHLLFAVVSRIAEASLDAHGCTEIARSALRVAEKAEL